METPREYKKECPGQFLDPRKTGTVTESDGTREVAWIVPDLAFGALMQKQLLHIMRKEPMSQEDIAQAGRIMGQWWHLMHLPESRQNKITRAIRARIEADRIERLRHQEAIVDHFAQEEDAHD
jgi:hypothetical protein